CGGPMSATASSSHLPALAIASPEVDVAVARKLVAGSANVIAVVPIAGQVETWPLMLRLTRALQLAGRDNLAVVRAPAVDAPPAPDQSPPTAGEPCRVVALDAGAAICELVMPPALGLAESAANLRRALAHVRGRFSHVLVGFDGYIPDVREAIELPDAFVTTARTGFTRETDLAEMVRRLPPSRHLGTLLVD
ncbi:MAG TPA: hypothetical protein VGF45_24025, partial [Polyangia bacterium]